MKKFLKIFSTILVISAIVAYFVCTAVIPTQMEVFNNTLTNILNYPLTIAGVSVTIGSIASYIIVKYVMNMTKFGRKELDNVNTEVEHSKQDINNFMNDISSQVNELKNDFDELKADCNNQCTVMLNQFEILQDRTLTALEAVPNRKVQLIVAQYKGEYEILKSEIIEKTINTDEYINEKIKKLEEMLNEAKEIFNNKAEEE